MATVILWASQVLASTVNNPEFALGAPDGKIVGLGAQGSMTLSAFQGRLYANLIRLLNGCRGGDAVTEAMLAHAHVIAFEANGGNPAPSGGWESSRWTFSDGETSVSFDWDERVGQPRPPEVIANGSTHRANYAAFFDFAPPAANEVYSYLLLRLPKTIDFARPAFTIQVQAWADGNHGEGSPDPDAVGIMPCTR